MQAITLAAQLNNIYNLLNKSLFDGKLPEDTVVMVAQITYNGHYRLGSWDETKERKECDEILINKKYLDNNSKAHWLTILLHQMIHQWQHYYGNETQSEGYHNQEYVEKAKSIGLIIDKSGRTIKESIEPEGKFMQVIKNSVFELTVLPRNVKSCSDKKPKSKGKEKYTCPECDKIIWGKSGMNDTLCGCNDSFKKMIEQFE